MSDLHLSLHLAPLAPSPAAGRPAKVTLVGAGPGDPELLTLRAVRALREAEVVLIDQLVSGGYLKQVNSATPGVVLTPLGTSALRERAAISLDVHAAPRASSPKHAPPSAKH